MRSLSLFLFALVLSVCSFAADLNQLTAQANAGDADAQYKLGTIYSSGDGVEQNFATAIEWFTKAARQGHAGAMYQLAVANYNGTVLGQDIAENLEMAWAWFSLADAAGNKDAEAEAARVAGEFDQRRRDSARAALVDTIAILESTGNISRHLRPDSDAAATLAKLTRAQQHLSKGDVRETVADCESVLSGKPRAEFCVGLLYQIQSPPDARHAINWFKSAANAREPHAMFHLSVLMADAKSPAYDPESAYFWSLLAQRYGDRRAATVINALEALLSSKEKKKAAGKAGRFAASHANRS